jgi:tartrate-resistant acid phosphatase type 5
MILRLLPRSRRQFLKSGIGSALSWPLFRPRTADATPEGLPFLVIGDWGRDGGRQQGAVAVQMGKAAASTGTRFVISVGDNFYSDGVASIDDPHWHASFEDVYDASALQVPWHAVLGNHDYRGNAEAQIAYSASSSRWRMPARFYKRTETEPGSGQVDFFHIDTCPFIEEYRGSKVRVDDQDAAKQLVWLDSELGRSGARWKIVVGHHPVFSGGSSHGSQPELIRNLKPLLDRHGVRAYFFGHDHDLQHIVVDGVHYLGCGAGADTRPTTKIAGSLFASDHPGFFSGKINGDVLDFSFVDTAGEAIYQAVIPLRV